MSRPRAHDPDAALEAAVELFHERGFAAVGVADLTAATGMPRSTLYADYGSKQGLWEAALGRYRSRVDDGLRATFDDEGAAGDPLDRVDGFLAASIDGLVDGSSRTCLVVSAACERGGDDPATTAIAEANVDAIRLRVQDALELARSAGELREDVDAAGLAALLTATIQGSRVLGRLPDQLEPARRALEHARHLLAEARA